MLYDLDNSSEGASGTSEMTFTEDTLSPTPASSGLPSMDHVSNTTSRDRFNAKIYCGCDKHNKECDRSNRECTHCNEDCDFASNEAFQWEEFFLGRENEENDEEASHPLPHPCSDEARANSTEWGGSHYQRRRKEDADTAMSLASVSSVKPPSQGLGPPPMSKTQCFAVAWFLTQRAKDNVVLRYRLRELLRGDLRRMMPSDPEFLWFNTWFSTAEHFANSGLTSGFGLPPMEEMAACTQNLRGLNPAQAQKMRRALHEAMPNKHVAYLMKLAER